MEAMKNAPGNNPADSDLANLANILPVAYFLPEKNISNDLLESLFPEWPSEKIKAKTGMCSRRVVSSGESSLTMAVEAAKKLFQDFAVQPGDIDYVVFCTQSPEYALPPNSTLLQSNLGLKQSVGCVDISHGCSGYIYCLSVAKGLIASEQAENILVITSETYSRYLADDDRTTRTIFGDGATATLINQENANRLTGFVFSTDGTGKDYLFLRNRNFVNSGAESEPHQLFMDGPTIYSYTLKTVPPLFFGMLEKLGRPLDEMDLAVFHQANSYMLESLRKKCAIPNDKFALFLENTGNTVSSSIPIALAMASEKRTFTSGKFIALVGFGVGLSSAACILKI